MAYEYEKNEPDLRLPLITRFFRKGDPGKTTDSFFIKRKLIAGGMAVIAWFSGTMMYQSFHILKIGFSQEATRNPIKAYGRCLTQNPLLALLILLISVSVYLIAMKAIKESDKKDPRGYIINPNSPEQRSRLMTEEEKHRIFDYRDYEDPAGLIVGKSKMTGELITVPWELTYKDDDSLSNLNVAVFGPPGTRKSSGILMGNIYSAIHKGLSIAVTDPKGEIYSETLAAAKENGYNVRIFNVQTGGFDKSDGWDVIKQIRESANPITDAQMVARIIFENTGDTEGFWNESAMTLFTAVLLYVAKGSNLEERYTKYPSSVGNLRTMQTVYDVVTDPEMEENIKAALINPKDMDLYGQAFLNWSTHSKKDTIKSDIGFKLSLFQNKDVSRILSEDEIDFREIAEHKTILYIICSDRDMTYKAVLTLFTSFMFNKVAEIADSYDDRKLPNTFYIIFEEMGNLGRIPNIGTYVATLRSRGIFLMFCNQTVGMLKSVYGKDDDPYEWEKILACCALQFCLSGSDLTTMDYFSKLSGKMAAKTRTTAKQVPVYSLFNFAISKRITEADREVPVLTPDDIKKIKVSEVAVFTAQHDVFIEDKYYYKDHPFYRYRLFSSKTHKEIPVKHADHIPEWKKRLDQQTVDELSQNAVKLNFEDDDWYIEQVKKKEVPKDPERESIRKYISDFIKKIFSIEEEKENKNTSSYSLNYFLNKKEDEIKEEKKPEQAAFYDENLEDLFREEALSENTSPVKVPTREELFGNYSY